MRGSRAAVGLVAAAVIFGGAAAHAQASAISFVESSIEVSLDEDPEPVEVAVVSSSDPGTDVSIQAIGGIADSVSFERDTVQLADDHEATFVMEVTAEAEAATGQLVAVAGGQLARVDVALTGPGSAAAPLPQSMSVAGIQWGPRTEVDPVDVPGLPEKREPCATVGELSGDNGFATVERCGSQVRFPDPPWAGTYDGVIDLDPATDDGDVEMTLTVKHGWALPLMALLAGLAVIGLLDWIKRDRLPRLVLSRRLAAWREEARNRAHEGATVVVAACPTWFAGPDDAVGRVTTGDAHAGDLLLDAAAATAARSWDTYVDERAGWAAGGEAFKAFRAQCQSYETYLAECAELAGEVARFRDKIRAENATTWTDGGPGTIAASCRSALDRSEITSTLELTEATSDVQAARKALRAATTVFELAERAREDRSLATEVRAVTARLLRASESELEALKKKAAELATGADVSVDASEAESLDAARQWSDATHSELLAPFAGAASSRMFYRALVGPSLTNLKVTSTDAQPLYDWNDSVIAAISPSAQTAVIEGGATELPEGRQVDANKVTVVAGEAEAIPPPPPPPEVPQAPPDFEELSRQLRNANRAFTVASFIIVVTSGMLALYWSDADFGASWTDYATMALWGAGLTQGLEFARRFTIGAAG